MGEESGLPNLTRVAWHDKLQWHSIEWHSGVRRGEQAGKSLGPRVEVQMTKQNSTSACKVRSEPAQHRHLERGHDAAQVWLQAGS